MNDMTGELARPGRVTLQQIAERLGVSTATVSLALRASPLVAEATREKVQDLARTLGYVYNRSDHREVAPRLAATVAKAHHHAEGDQVVHADRRRRWLCQVKQRLDAGKARVARAEPGHHQRRIEG